MKINSILIANRGEIAVRIIHAAKELDIKTVTVYSEIDRLALHVKKADEAYVLLNKGIEPYLDEGQILDIAHKAQVDAIHPGYGFLSENATFAEKVKDHGFIFIGPSSESIKRMGDKLRAKEMAKLAGVPVIPGYEIEDEDDPGLIDKANHIGYPVLLKARAGGGGKGMHIVHSATQLKQQIQRSIREATEAFGDGSIFMEKLIQKPRHIEIQILADQHGNAIHLFERECSIQRRHQKIIEEAPSSILGDDLRLAMGNAALQLVKKCNYINAGTLEFILDEHNKFYFLEMNTRLQVEHPVTECITGLDIVKQQIWIAEGKPLSLTQSDLKINGHAIELRIYAEDPRNAFLPDVGTLKKYATPEGIGVRVDNGCEQGMEIPLEYDPLIAKLIVHDTNRDGAIARMKRAIEEYEIDGVGNTLEFGAWVMQDADFRTGDFDTGFIANKLDKFTSKTLDVEESLIAAVVSHTFADQVIPERKSISKTKTNWRNRRKG